MIPWWKEHLATLNPPLSLPPVSPPLPPLLLVHLRLIRLLKMPRPTRKWNKLVNFAPNISPCGPVCLPGERVSRWKEVGVSSWIVFWVWSQSLNFKRLHTGTFPPSSSSASQHVQWKLNPMFRFNWFFFFFFFDRTWALNTLSLDTWAQIWEQLIHC